MTYFLVQVGIADNVFDIGERVHNGYIDYFLVGLVELLGDAVRQFRNLLYYNWCSDTIQWLLISSAAIWFWIACIAGVAWCVLFIRMEKVRRWCF